MVDLVSIGLSILVISILIFIFKFFIIPYQLITFYRKQGIPMHFYPVIGSYNKDLNNSYVKGDYYTYYNSLAKQSIRPKAIGKNLGTRVQLYLIDPEAISQFFINHDLYIKDPFLNSLTMILSKNGLAMTEGKIWRKHRKLISSGFRFDVLRDIIPDIIETCDTFLEEFKNKPMEKISLFDFCKLIAGEIIGKIFFGESLGQQTIQGMSMTLFLAELMARIIIEPSSSLFLMFGMPLVNTNLIPRQRKIINDIIEFRSRCREIVRRNMQKRKEQYNNSKNNYQYQESNTSNIRKNMFDIFFDFQLINPNEQLSEDELIDEYIAFFSDGIYTTGHFISMLIYYLETNKEWKAKVDQEAKGFFKDISDVNLDSLAKLEILTACMKETMRLAPPAVTGIERIALGDHELAGIKIKKGTILAACHCANHLDPRFHDEPNKFNPSRWLEPSKTQDSIKAFPSTYVPFSLGARHCIGQNFALNEAKIVLILLLRKFQFELDDKNYQLKFIQRFLREPLEPMIFNFRSI